MSQQQHKIFSATSLSIYGMTVLFYTIVYMVLIILPIYTHAQQASYISIGWIMGITMLTSMVCRPLAGRLIDRYGASPIFFIAICVFAFSLSGYFLDSALAYWSVRLIQGAVAACFSTAMEIITINLLSDRLRTQGLSFYSLATVIPTVFTPALSLYLLQYTSVQSLFVLLLILGIGNVLFGWYLFKKTVSLDMKSKSPEKKSQTLKDFFGRAQLLFPTLIMILVSVGNGAIFTFFPLYLASMSSTFAENYFLLQMLTLVCTRFFVAKFLKSDAIFPVRLVFLLLILVVSGFMIISFYPSNLGLSMAAVANGIAFALIYPILLTVISFRIKSVYKGYFLGIFIGGADFGFSMGAILIGVIAQVFSLQMAFVFCAGLLFIALPLCILTKYFEKLALSSRVSSMAP